MKNYLLALGIIFLTFLAIFIFVYKKDNLDEKPQKLVIEEQSEEASEPQKQLSVEEILSRSRSGAVKAALELIKKKRLKVKDIPAKYLDDKKFVTDLISGYIYVVKGLPEKYRDDPEIMLKAIKLVGSLDYASDRLKDDKEFVMEFIKEKPDNIKYISERLQKDPDIINLVIGSDSGAHLIQYIPDDMLTKAVITRLVINYNSSYDNAAYQYVPDSFKKDKEIFEIAFELNYESFDYALLEFKEDEDYVLKLAKNKPEVLRLDFDLKNSESFRKEVKEMIDGGEIPFDPSKSYEYHNPFLNEVYFSKYVADNGKTLSLKLKNGKTKDINYILGPQTGNNPDHYVIPSFEGYLEDLGFYVIRIGYYEGSKITLINDETGEEFDLHDYPKFSPDKKHIIFAESVDSYGFSGIEVYEIEPHKIKSVYKKSDHGFTFDSWLDNQSFLLKRLGDEEGIENFIIKKDDDKWIMEKKKL